MLQVLQESDAHVILKLKVIQYVNSCLKGPVHSYGECLCLVKVCFYLPSLLKEHTVVAAIYRNLPLTSL